MKMTDWWNSLGVFMLSFAVVLSLQSYVLIGLLFPVASFVVLFMLCLDRRYGSTYSPWFNIAC